MAGRKDELEKVQQHANMILHMQQAIEASQHITGHDASTLGNDFNPAHPFFKFLVSCFTFTWVEYSRTFVQACVHLFLQLLYVKGRGKGGATSAVSAMKVAFTNFANKLFGGGQCA